MTKPSRLARAVGAFALAVAVVFGVPFALVTFVGWPLPTAVPAGSTVSMAWRANNVPDAVVVRTLACIMWIAWAQMTVAIVWELAVNVPRVSVGRPKRPAVVVNRHV